MEQSSAKNELTSKVIGASIEVHKALGPGLLESAYEACLAYELREQGILVEQQKELPLIYKGVSLDVGYRIDLLIEKSIIVELKAVTAITDVHKAQVLSYMKLAKCSLGLLLNFNVKYLKNGITRFAL